MKTEASSVQNNTLTQVFWLAGAVGTAAAVASWAYSRKKPSHWDRAKSILEPWVGMLVSAAGLVSAARSRKFTAKAKDAVRRVV
jgi:hypothetical protein